MQTSSSFAAPPILRAPWTPDQVAALNAYQHGRFHPFTCCSAVNPDNCRDKFGFDAALVATENGWVCETCDYTQDWAHSRMVELGR